MKKSKVHTQITTHRQTVENTDAWAFLNRVLFILQGILEPDTRVFYGSGEVISEIHVAKTKFQGVTRIPLVTIHE